MSTAADAFPAEQAAHDSKGAWIIVPPETPTASEIARQARLIGAQLDGGYQISSGPPPSDARMVVHVGQSELGFPGAELDGGWFFPLLTRLPEGESAACLAGKRILCGTISEANMVLRAPAGRPIETSLLVARRGQAPDSAMAVTTRSWQPFVCYIGDISFAGECDELFADWAAVQDRPRARSRTLVLIGHPTEKVPDRPDVKCLPAPADDQLGHVIGRAAAVIAPTVVGLGATAYQCFALGTPLLVHERNIVAAEEVRRSGAGLIYSTTEQFVQGVIELIDNPMAYRAAARRQYEAATRQAGAWPRALGRDIIS